MRLDERGSADDDFFWFILWIFIIVFVFLPLFSSGSNYDDKAACLDEWTACERVDAFIGDEWVPTNEAREVD